MAKQQNPKLRQSARLALIALALGAGYYGLRQRRKEQARSWQAHLERASIRTALVTGASAGIGRAYAARLAEMGYNLVLVARRAGRLQELSGELQARCGVQVAVLPADLSTEEGIASVEQHLARSPVDFLVNNAGYDVFGEFARLPIEKNLALVRCLELATLRLTRAALPGMLARRRGAVVNLSSIGAFTPKRADAVYVASKAFVNQLTETLALELKDSGVRVQALCPGFTLTEFHDAPEYAPYHIKERIPRWAWMTSEQVVAASLQALGQNQVVCVPGLLNQGFVAAAKSGLSQGLMGILASFFPPKEPALALPENALELLACPACHGPLQVEGTLEHGPLPASGALVCPACQKKYPIQDGIPRFALYEDLQGYNRRFAGLYDWFSIFYRLFSKAAFAFIGATEEAARREILDRLEPCGGRVLEVSVGPGVNLAYLREDPQVGEIYGLDLSNGQLRACSGYAQRRGWPVAVFQGNAEALPFRDNAFESVFHIGGINFFNDKKKAIAEMIRVAKPGARIAICDENERGARGYELTLPGFKTSFQGRREPVRPPLDLVPPEMEDIRLDETAWKGWFYIIDFRKPVG